MIKQIVRDALLRQIEIYGRGMSFERCLSAAWCAGLKIAEGVGTLSMRDFHSLYVDAMTQHERAQHEAK